jgi:hypothetical protein
MSDSVVQIEREIVLRGPTAWVPTLVKENSLAKPSLLLKSATENNDAKRQFASPRHIER